MSKHCQAPAADMATQAVSGLPISDIGSSWGMLPVSVPRLLVASTFHSRTEGQTGSKRRRVVVLCTGWVWLDATQLTVWPLCCMLGWCACVFLERNDEMSQILLQSNSCWLLLMMFTWTCVFVCRRVLRRISIDHWSLYQVFSQSRCDRCSCT